jgi:hypothetical protein
MISKTNTKMGNFIRFFTRYDYNHVSLSLDKELKSFVSFARIVQDAPLYGGFVTESFERFLHKGKNSLVKIYEVDITNEKYDNLKKLFSLADNPDNGLVYNYLDALMTPVGINVKIKGAYTCLSFANTVLGTNCKNIKALSDTLKDKLIYSGTIKDLGVDSGDRSALYFHKIGFRKGTKKSAKSFLIVCKRMIHTSTNDNVNEILK